MRLIDADKLQQDLIDQIDWLRKQDYELYCAIGDDITFCIDKQPTAYDVDEVVKNLEELRDRFNKKDFAIRGIIEKAIEIVKEGYVDKQTNK